MPIPSVREQFPEIKIDGFVRQLEDLTGSTVEIGQSSDSTSYCQQARRRNVMFGDDGRGTFTIFVYAIDPTTGRPIRGPIMAEYSGQHPLYSIPVHLRWHVRPRSYREDNFSEIIFPNKKNR